MKAKRSRRDKVSARNSATTVAGQGAGAEGAAGAPATTADGSELKMLDSLLPTLLPRAQAGDEAAIDRVLSVLELRLKYKREKRVED